MTLYPEPLEPRRRKIAVIFDDRIRPDTTGEYCRRALEGLGHIVSHYGPGETAEIPPIYDLYLWVDDDLEYTLPDGLHPLAYWAVDTHRDYARRFARGRGADVVFCAQQNAARRMRAEGIRNAHWLPLACDPETYHPIAGSAMCYDVAFVEDGPSSDEGTRQLGEWITRTYPRSFVGRASAAERARIFRASRLVLNCAIQDEIAPTIFEALGCGSLVVTNDLRQNGQDLLLTPGAHLVAYADGEELLAHLARWLGDDEGRRRMAEAGMREVLARHTYQHRLADLLAAALEGADLAVKYPPGCREAEGDAWAEGQKRRRVEGRGAGEPHSEDGSRESRADDRHASALPASPIGRPQVSIIIPCSNDLALTRRCVASIRRSTDIPCEIILVDGGSTDGTAGWAQGEGLRVIANSETPGFSGACNQGILASVGASVLLLSNDTVVPTGWLERLIAHTQADRAVCLAGSPTDHSPEDQGIAVRRGSREEVPALRGEHPGDGGGGPQGIAGAPGVCLLIPRRLVTRLGLLDERFATGGFGVQDYCLRTRIAGYHVVWAQEVFLRHEGRPGVGGACHATAQSLHEDEERYTSKWDVGRYSQPAERPEERERAAWDLLRAERYAEAYDAFEGMARSNPADARALVGLGLAAEGRGAPAAAALAYRAVLRLIPGDPDALRGLGRAEAHRVPAIGSGQAAPGPGPGWR